MMQTSRIDMMCAYACIDAFVMSTFVYYIWVHKSLGITHVCGLSMLWVLA